jgi:metal-responsive CopG/Arc/MetJ family transcriptional regulator
MKKTKPIPPTPVRLDELVPQIDSLIRDGYAKDRTEIIRHGTEKEIRRLNKKRREDNDTR